MIMTGDICTHPNCGGALAGEADMGAWRLFCTNCGRDRWIEIPERRPGEFSVKYTAGESAVGQRCIDCGADISKRHQKAIRCIYCAITAQNLARNKSSKNRKVAV